MENADIINRDIYHFTLGKNLCKEKIPSIINAFLCRIPDYKIYIA